MSASRLFLALATSGVFLFVPELRAQATPEAQRLYQQGAAAEKAGDMKTAVGKYLASAKIGNPVADQKLGQLYDRGAGKALPRDLQESIAHYQNARQGGVNIKGPTERAPQFSK